MFEGRSVFHYDSLSIRFYDQIFASHIKNRPILDSRNVTLALPTNIQVEEL